MSSYTKRDTERLNSSILRLSLHGNPELTLSISNRSIPQNLSALWHLGMKKGDSKDDPIMFPDSEDPEESDESRKRLPEDDAGGHISRPKTSSGLYDAMYHLTVHHAPPVPRWYVSRQNHCIHAILNNLPHNENVVLSPFSLISCMAMLCRGATLGLARDQLAHYCWPCAGDATVCDDSVAFSALSDFVHQLENVKVCRNANILMTDHVNVQEYKDDLFTQFRAEPYHLENYERVNTKVQEITNIPKKVLYGEPKGTVLINAVYFADQWVYEFDTELTPRPFIQPSGLSVRVDMMRQKNRLSMAKFDSGTAVHLEYKTRGLGAWFVKHDSDHTHGGAYRALERFLQHEFVKKTLHKTTTHVDLTVPKFTMNSSIDLRKLFYQTTEHNITYVFQPKGHLSRMSTDDNEFVSRFEQECILEVDQKGTVAAAFTFSAATRSPGPHYESVSFQHTFYMVIHHNDIILFVAKVASPTPSVISQAPPPVSHQKPQTITNKKNKKNQQIPGSYIIVKINNKPTILMVDTKQHDGKDDEVGKTIDYTETTVNDIPVWTYEVDLLLLIRVVIGVPKQSTVPNDTKVKIQAVYINDKGKDEPEDPQEFEINKPCEIPFPLQKETADEGEDGWDLRDAEGNTLLKLRFILQKSNEINPTDTSPGQ
jgi:serine protease inhibitor